MFYVKSRHLKFPHLFFLSNLEIYSFHFIRFIRWSHIQSIHSIFLNLIITNCSIKIDFFFVGGIENEEFESNELRMSGKKPSFIRVASYLDEPVNRHQRLMVNFHHLLLLHHHHHRCHQNRQNLQAHHEERQNLQPQELQPGEAYFQQQLTMIRMPRIFNKI